MKLHADKAPLVTIVVPVHNDAPYVRMCLDSVAGQTYQNLEIVVVDDGSSDGGGEICNRVAMRDSRFSVVHTENRGLSAARNVGVAHARGDYLVFLDSDDWIEPNAIEVLVAAALRENADVVVCAYVRERLDGTRAFSSGVSPRTKLAFLCARWNGPVVAHRSVVRGACVAALAPQAKDLLRLSWNSC